jgi:outer membrane cobalamin receptor
LVLSIVILFSIPALADNIDIDELASLSLEDLLDYEIVTASKKAERSSDAPNVVTVITRKDIEAYGANNLFDLMQMVPGVQPISSHLFPENALTLRGGPINHSDFHVLILMDGRPMREGIQGGQNMMIYTTFPVSIIERIEIIRGPGSALYGSNAFVGVINIITRKPEDKNRVEVQAGGGSFETYHGETSGNLAAGDFRFVYGFRGFDEKGWKYKAATAFPGPSPTVVTDSTDYGKRSGSAAGTFYYKNLKVSMFYSDFNYRMLGGVPNWEAAGKVYGRRLFADLNYRNNITSKWSANVDVTHNYYHFVISNADREGYHLATDYIAEAYLSGELSPKFDVIIGGLVENLRKPKHVENEPIPTNYSLINSSLYSQGNYVFLDKLKFTAGIQLIKPDRTDLESVLRFGMVYRLFHHSGIKILYGEAFRSPYPTELFIDGAAVKGNSSLKPERIATTDIQAFYSDNRLSITASAFHSHFRDLIVRVDYPPLPRVQTYANLGKMTIVGTELEVTILITPTLSSTGSFIYQNDRNANTYIPDTITKLGLAYAKGNIKIGIFNTYFGKPYPNQGLVVNPPAEAVNLLSLNVLYHLPWIDGTSLNFYGQNLLDEDYYYTEFSKGWINTLPMGPGLAVYGRLIYELGL